MPTSHAPHRTAWGHHDFSHTYQINFPGKAHIMFQRPKDYARRLAAGTKSDASYADKLATTTPPGTKALAERLRTSPVPSGRARWSALRTASCRR